MVQDFYRAMEWDPFGSPNKRKVEEAIESLSGLSG
jgi:hypothetical protein